MGNESTCGGVATPKHAKTSATSVTVSSESGSSVQRSQTQHQISSMPFFTESRARQLSGALASHYLAIRVKGPEGFPTTLRQRH